MGSGKGAQTGVGRDRLKEFEAAIELSLPGALPRAALRRGLVGCGSADALLNCRSRSRLRAAGLREAEISLLWCLCRSEEARRRAELAAAVGARLIRLGESAYPKLLAQIPDPPAFLWVRGTLPAAQGIGIVGARRATGYGLAAASECARSVAACRPVISGLARGVDAAAHRAALDVGGETVAVMATGVEQVYPRRHRGLARDILESGGALVTEYPPGTGPMPYHFPARNRIISGLSEAVVVVQGTEASGALITARCALDQSRDVYAVPGRIDEAASRGPNQLVAAGEAQLVLSPDHLRTLLGLGDEAAPGIAPLPPGLQKVLATLGHEPVHVDDVAVRIGESSAVVAERLLQLELQGLVRSVAGGRFCTARLKQG